MLMETELEPLIEDLIKENKDLLDERGKAAFGTLMGLMMKKVRGKANVEVVAKVLRNKLE